MTEPIDDPGTLGSANNVFQIEEKVCAGSQRHLRQRRKHLHPQPLESEADQLDSRPILAPVIPGPVHREDMLLDLVRANPRQVHDRVVLPVELHRSHHCETRPFRTPWGWAADRKRLTWLIVTGGSSLADRHSVLRQSKVLHLPVPNAVPPHPPGGVSDPKSDPEKRLRNGREWTDSEVVSGKSSDPAGGRRA